MPLTGRTARRLGTPRLIGELLIDYRRTPRRTGRAGQPVQEVVAGNAFTEHAGGHPEGRVRIVVPEFLDDAGDGVHELTFGQPFGRRAPAELGLDQGTALGRSGDAVLTVVVAAPGHRQGEHAAPQAAREPGNVGVAGGQVGYVLAYRASGRIGVRLVEPAEHAGEFLEQPGGLGLVEVAVRGGPARPRGYGRLEVMTLCGGGGGAVRHV